MFILDKVKLRVCILGETWHLSAKICNYVIATLECPKTRKSPKPDPTRIFRVFQFLTWETWSFIRWNPARPGPEFSGSGFFPGFRVYHVGHPTNSQRGVKFLSRNFSMLLVLLLVLQRAGQSLCELLLLLLLLCSLQWEESLNSFKWVCVLACGRHSQLKSSSQLTYEFRLQAVVGSTTVFRRCPRASQLLRSIMNHRSRGTAQREKWFKLDYFKHSLILIL